MSSLTPVKRAIDVAFKKSTSHASVAKGPRPGRQSEIEVQTLRALKDACPWADADMARNKKVNGRTLYEAIYDAKARAAAGEKITFGKHFYAKLRSEFESEDSIESLLEGPADVVETPALVRAMVQFCKHPPNRGVLRQYCSVVQTVNAADSRALCKLLHRLTPQASQDQRMTAMSIVECLARLSVWKTETGLLDLMFDKIDHVLLAVRRGKRKRNVSTCHGREE
eukprot:6492571-Amphidinium_carterae.2